MSDARDPLRTRNAGDFPPYFNVRVPYEKVSDLRYGTNPSQTAALYNNRSFLGRLRELRTGKDGPSQTNMEDILFAAYTVGFFGAPAVAVMKHENPSGFATAYKEEPVGHTFRKAWDADFVAAFGCTAFLNRPIDRETLDAMRGFIEVVVAPGYEEGVVEGFRNEEVRVFEYSMDDLNAIPRFTGDKFQREVLMRKDGSVIVADPLLTPIRTVDDLRPYVVSDTQPTERELQDLLTGYRIALRSNSIRMIKNGYTTALGTGQQDRLMCLKIAAFKNQDLAETAREKGRERAADYSIPGSVVVHDAFQMPDNVDFANNLGITAVLAPHGGKRFNEVKDKINLYGMAFVDLPGELRLFDHH